MSASPPPDGDRNHGAPIVIVQTIFVTIASLLVLARLLTRTVLVKNIGLDDFFIVLGNAFAIVVLVFNGIMVHHGYGRHVYYLQNTPGLLSTILKWQYLSELLIIPAVMFTKISIALFLLRIFGTKKAWRLGLLSILALTVVTNVLSFAFLLASCKPFRKLWEPQLPGICWGLQTLSAIAEFNGATALVIDWALASLPVVFMWNVQIRIHTKAGICFLMGMGFFTGICTIMRTVLVKSLANPDVTWSGVVLDIWSPLEETVGLIAACIPTLKPLFSPSARHPSKSKGRSYKFTGRSVPPQEEDRHQLHEVRVPRTLPTPLSDMNAGTKLSCSQLGGRQPYDMASQTTTSIEGGTRDGDSGLFWGDEEGNQI